MREMDPNGEKVTVEACRGCEAGDAAGEPVSVQLRPASLLSAVMQGGRQVRKDRSRLATIHSADTALTEHLRATHSPVLGKQWGIRSTQALVYESHGVFGKLKNTDVKKK